MEETLRAKDTIPLPQTLCIDISFTGFVQLAGFKLLFFLTLLYPLPYNRPKDTLA